MFTPQMPYLLVLVGDDAIKEAEHTLSSLRDHVKSTHHPMLEVLCLVDDKNNYLTLPTGNGIQVSYYPLQELFANNNFGALAMEKRVGINNRIPAEIRLEVINNSLGLALVVRGTRVSSQSIFALQKQVKLVMDAMQNRLYSQLCYLTEDDPSRFTRQADWLRDPDDRKKIKEGFRAFNDMLVLSARQVNGYDGVEVEHQQKESFPLGLLYMLNHRNDSPHTRLATLQFGKINGSSYEIKQLIRHITANRLENWTKPAMTAWQAWELLGNQELPLRTNTNNNDAREMLLSAIEAELQTSMPTLEDLACVGLSNTDVDLQAVLLSFNALNESRFLSNNASTAWAQNWLSQVLLKIDDRVHIDPLLEHLSDEGSIGWAISNAKVGARMESNAIADSDNYLRRQWENISYPKRKLLESFPQYHYRCLAGLRQGVYDLWKIRGMAARLEALDEQRRVLVSHLKQWIKRRQDVLRQYYLTDQELQVLERTCGSFMKDALSIADHYPVHELPGFDDLFLELYHDDKLEKVWQSLFDGFLKKAFERQPSYADAFIQDTSPTNLAQRIENYNRYNDGILLPQLPVNANQQNQIVYPIAETVYKALEGRHIPGAQIVSIPGDLIEKMTLVNLGGIDQLTQLQIFEDLDMPATPVPMAFNMAAPQPLTGTDPVVAHQTHGFTAKLMEDNREWWLYWDWAGPENEPAILTWNGHQASVSYRNWSDRGQRFNLNATRVPHGRFPLQIQCGDYQGETVLEGKRIGVSLHKETMRNKIKLTDGGELACVNLQLAGEAALAATHCLLKKGREPRAFLYDVFAFGDPSIAPGLGPIYTNSMEELTLEGRGEMEGFIKVDQMGDW